jgi:hypothetical protein
MRRFIRKAIEERVAGRGRNHVTEADVDGAPGCTAVPLLNKIYWLSPTVYYRYRLTSQASALADGRERPDHIPP